MVRRVAYGILYTYDISGATPFVKRFSRGRRESPAAIIADFHLLDGATGFDAIELVRAAFGCAKIPAIVVTGDPSEATRRRAAERGFGYLVKPLHGEQLRALLADMLSPA
jgi:DNA-binding response OmpR family regulator